MLECVRPAIAVVVSVMELELRGGFGPNDEEPKSRLQKKNCLRIFVSREFFQKATILGVRMLM